MGEVLDRKDRRGRRMNDPSCCALRLLQTDLDTSKKRNTFGLPYGGLLFRCPKCQKRWTFKDGCWRRVAT